MPATIAQVIAALSSVLPTLTQMIAVLGTPRLARLNLVASRGYILGASSSAPGQSDRRDDATLDRDRGQRRLRRRPSCSALSPRGCVITRAECPRAGAG